ncbi:MAG: metal-dependent transcriptional regulator [Ruthenibacterium sp.]
MKLTPSQEDYLEAVLVLQLRRGCVYPVDVARFMGCSKPSVSNAIKVLGRKGCLIKKLDGTLMLTSAGRQCAEQIYERHRFFTARLIAAGVAPETAEHDACSIEHVISEEAFRALKCARKP